MKISVLQRLGICFFLCLAFSACSKSGREPLGRVISVYDGDTITVLNARKEQIKVRFYGIDAPELRQAYGSAAKKELSDLVFGKEVGAEVLVPKDKYGRMAAKIYVGDTCINEELVRRGFAWWYADNGKQTAQYEDLQRQAKAARKGLWADGRSIPPWRFRQEEEEKRVLKRIETRRKKEKEAVTVEK